MKFGDIMSLFRCPLCLAPLTREESAYRCPTGHSFDISAAGYTHLLPANKKNSKAPGDDKQMVAARTAFLEKGYYAPLLDALATLVAEDAKDFESPVLLDSGCGEGYYTAGLSNALQTANAPCSIAGVDISKFALKKAAKRLPSAEFAVASVYHLPLCDGSVHLLTNVFSPLAIEEFARLIPSGGYFYYVVPSARHLWQMKEILYKAPYENEVHCEEYEGFALQSTTPVRYTAHLTASTDIMALFGMTPYAWKTPKEGVDKLATYDALDTEIGFDVHRYRRI